MCFRLFTPPHGYCLVTIASMKLYMLVQTGNAFIGGLYYPPAPFQYTSSDVLDYIEAAVEELNSTFPETMITLAGDFNQLPEQDIVSRTGLTPIVSQPTRDNNKLDRIYVFDHKAIIVFSGPAPVTRGKNSMPVARGVRLVRSNPP